MGDPLSPSDHSAVPAISRWWALPLALTVAATGILWDPQSTTYGTLKGVALSLGALTAVIVAGLRVRRGDSWDLGGPLLAVLGLVVWAGISLWWTPSVPAGLGELAPATAAVILLLAGRVLVRGVGAARLLATAMAGSGMVASIVALAEYSLGHRMISGTIGNPNHLAIYIAATGPALVWLAWSSPRGVPIPLRWRLVRLVALLTPLLAAMWLTGCRSAWVAVGVGGLFAGALTRPTPRGRWLGLGAATALCLVVVLGVVAMVGPRPWRQRLGGRIYLARISSTLITAGGATGHGVGSFALQFPEHQAIRLAAHPAERSHWTNARTAHCEPLHLLAELGPVGGLLLLMVTIFVIGAMVGGRDPPSPHRLVASIGLVILGVAGLAEGSLHAVALLTLATASAALLWEPQTNRGGGLHHATWVAVVLVFGASALVVTAARTYAADHLLARSHLTAGTSQRVSLLRRAIHLAPNPGRARFYLGLVQAHHGHPRAAVQTLRLSAVDFPNLGTHLALGNALMAQGRIRKAAQAYKHAAWLHPRYAAAHHNLGLALKRLGQPRASAASLRRAQRLWPGRWLERWRIRAIRRLIRPAAGPS